MLLFCCLLLLKNRKSELSSSKGFAVVPCTVVALSALLVVTFGYQPSTQHQEDCVRVRQLPVSIETLGHTYATMLFSPI